MVKVELSYNPYLLETKVRFNGQAPRINSLVEKYDQSMLQTWIKQIPEIFYNEMNGYDFELEFSGPKRDYVIKQSVDLQFSKAYDAFTDFLAEKNVEEFNDFMNNKWYDLNQDAYWYDSHKSKENIYAGYWCWLAAAVLKMVGMTSEGKYIPRDLI